MTKTAHDGTRGLNRRALFLIFGGALAPVGIAGSMVTIFGSEPWYRERPESEQEWTGRLRKADSPQGPGSRDSLAFTFHTRSQSLPVYASGVVGKLDRFRGLRVTARGKMVDLHSEGFGLELWLGTIRTI